MGQRESGPGGKGPGEEGPGREWTRWRMDQVERDQVERDQVESRVGPRRERMGGKAPGLFSFLIMCVHVSA